MSVASLPPAVATYVAFSRARLHSKHQFHILCILWLLLLCVFGYAPSAYAQPTPYGGTAVTVAASGTTKVEAENYDLGGEGVAYHDVDNGGQTSYRSDNIGVYSNGGASNGGASNGYAVGWGQVGEWSGYTLNVAAAGTYALTAHAGSSAGGGTFHLEFGPVGQVGGACIIQSSEFTVPNTGSWGSYQDVIVPSVNLPAGLLWMRLVLDSGSTGCGPYVADFDCFRLTSITPGKPAPYNGSPITVAASGTTKVETENYDLGGEGVAYHDMGNGGLTAYRSDNIGVYADNYASNSFAVGYAQAGEWDGYTLNVSAAGSYVPTAHLANPAGGGTFHLEFGPVGQIGGAGVTRSGEFTVPNTGSWGNYQDVTSPAVNLPAGPLWMRVVLDSGSTGCGPYLANFDCFSLTPQVLVPTNLIATGGNGRIILTWNTSSGAVSYNLYRSTTAGGEGSTPYQSSLTATNYTDTNVTPGTTYYYTVTSVNAGGESAKSVEASAVPLPSSILVQSRVIQIAAAFCQAVGAPVDISTAVAQFPAPKRYPGQQDTYWLPRWLIHFGSNADVEVVDSTGIVNRYYNFALSRQLMASGQPAGPSLAEADALQKVTSALQATGQTEPLGSASDNNFQITSPATSAGNLWYVSWPRQFQGVSYHQQQAIVMLQAETGALKALSLTFPTPPAISSTATITNTQASAVAQLQLQTLGIQNATAYPPVQQFVQPNTFWQQNGSASPQPGSAVQLAWVCAFTDSTNTNWEVWVDSNSGTAIGGNVAKTLARRVKAPAVSRPSPLNAPPQHSEPKIKRVQG